MNRVDGVIIGATRVLDRQFEHQSGQTKDYKICICCISAKHVALRGQNIDWLSWIQNNVSEWRDMSTHGLLFQCAKCSTMKLQLTMLV
jgi:hypothetical protein